MLGVIMQQEFCNNFNLVTMRDILVYSKEREAFCFSGDCQGRAIQAMVLERGFEFQCHLKNSWKDGLGSDGRK